MNGSYYFVEQLPFSASPVFLDRSKHFVVGIPELAGGGSPLRVPDDRIGNRGESIREPGDRGFLYFDGQNGKWLGVRGDGSEAILFEDIDEEDVEIIRMALGFVGWKKRPTSLPTIKHLSSVVTHWLFPRGMSHVSLAEVAKMRRLTSPLTQEKEEDEPAVFGSFQSMSPIEYRAVNVVSRFWSSGRQYPDGAVIVTDGTRRVFVSPDRFIKRWIVRDGRTERPVDPAKDLPPFVLS